MSNEPPRRGTFLALLLAEATSALGSRAMCFALGLTVFQRTGSATFYGLTALAALAPGVLVAPFAGFLADARDRRLILVTKHVGAALSGLALLLLLSYRPLDLWGALALVALTSVFEGLGTPALNASVPFLVPAQKLPQANGMVQLSAAMPQFFGPAAASLLLTGFHLRAIACFQIVTTLAAAAVVLSIHLPKPTPRVQSPSEIRSSEAWHYLRHRPGLLGLLGLYSVENFNLGILEVVIAPLVLGFAASGVLAWVLTAGGLGLITGSVVMSVWGGPRLQLRGVLGFLGLHGALLLVGAAHPSVPLVTLGAFGILFTVPFVDGCSNTLWQRKVPRALQGRVFALRTFMGGACLPLGFVVAGPWVDRFEPLMGGPGRVATSLRDILGAGAGRGAALVFVLLGLTTLAATLGAICWPRIRRMEDELPDDGLEAAPLAMSERV